MFYEIALTLCKKNFLWGTLCFFFKFLVVKNRVLEKKKCSDDDGRPTVFYPLFCVFFLTFYTFLHIKKWLKNLQQKSDSKMVNNFTYVCVKLTHVVLLSLFTIQKTKRVELHFMYGGFRFTVIKILAEKNNGGIISVIFCICVHPRADVKFCSNYHKS